MAFAYLAAALVAASAIAITAYQLWDSWLLGIAVIIFGPLAIAWLMSRMNPKD